MSHLTPSPVIVDGTDFRFGIVAARFNQVYVDGLLERVVVTLKSSGVQDENIKVERVPGSNELPLAAKFMADSGRFDALLALGTIIKGGTYHFEMVADGSNYGIHKVALDTGVPIVNGVIVGAKEEDVKERCVGSIPKGEEFGQCALEMAQLRRRYSK